MTLLCVTTLHVMAQKKSTQKDSYNYTRGVEAVKNNDLEEGFNYLQKELDESPNNGYAWGWMASLYMKKNEYGAALNSINKSIQYLPNKDKHFRSYAYSLRGDIYYEQLNENEKALADYNQAVELDPSNVDRYENRANLYYYTKRYDKAETDYRKIIALDEGGVLGYMGLGRNANALGNYEEAIRQFDQVIKMHNDYPSAHSFRAESNTLLGNFTEAVDDVIAALEIGYESKAYYYVRLLADSAFVPLSAKLKAKVLKNPNNDYWPYYLGTVYQKADKFKDAILYFQKSYDLDPSPGVAYSIANCYNELGNNTEALAIIDHQLEEDSLDYNFLGIKIKVLNEMDRLDEALALAKRYVDYYPDDSFIYLQRGYLYECFSNTDAAFDDFNTSILLGSQLPNPFMARGRISLERGDTLAAYADFTKCLEMDEKSDTPGRNKGLVSFYMGEADMAKAAQQIYLAENPDKYGYYNTACLYALLDEEEPALNYLRTALEKGYIAFNFIRRDPDFRTLCTNPLFEALIQEFEQKNTAENLGSDTADSFIERIVEIPFMPEGGVFKVNCHINNLPLYFIFDTGASDISISTVEATFMLKNNYLTPEDILGKQNYMTASGEISEGTVINLRSVNFGGLDLSNIRASVVKSQNAPLLLGQTVLKRLGKIEIDNDKRVLKVYYKEKK